MKFSKDFVKNNPGISTILFLLIILLLGGFLRIQYLHKTDFVINDGGLFFTMIHDLQRNGFHLPVYTSYNKSNIPFAYPPLSIYSAAILNQFLNINLIDIFRYYPLIFNLISIPAFYFLSKEITRNTRQSILSTAFYSILLPSYEWLISGGGLTRSPAHTLFIISLTLYLVFLRTKRKRFFTLSIIFASIMTLHHIEYSWMLIFSVVLFSLYSLKLRTSFLSITVFCFGIAALTSPYWITIIKFHGIFPFIYAFSAGEFSLLSSITRLVMMAFTGEPFPYIINSLAVIGLIYCIFAKNLRLVIWFFLILFLNPRSANRSLIFPVTIFAAIAIDQIILPALNKLEDDRLKGFSSPQPIIKSPHGIAFSFANIFIIFSIASPFIMSYLNTYINQPILTALTQSERDAMEWIRSNVPDDGKFIVIDPSAAWSLDHLGEWFPALSDRKSFTTIQGSEWLPGNAFDYNKKAYDSLKGCINVGVECIDTWSIEHKMDFTYVLISKGNCQMNSVNCINFLEAKFDTCRSYLKIYENDEISIYKKIGI
jgi:hypothetical protein